MRQAGHYGQSGGGGLYVHARVPAPPPPSCFSRVLRPPFFAERTNHQSAPRRLSARGQPWRCWKLPWLGGDPRAAPRARTAPFLAGFRPSPLVPPQARSLATPPPYTPHTPATALAGTRRHGLGAAHCSCSAIREGPGVIRFKSPNSRTRRCAAPPSGAAGAERAPRPSAGTKPVPKERRRQAGSLWRVRSPRGGPSAGRLFRSRPVVGQGSRGPIAPARLVLSSGRARWFVPSP